MKDLIDRCNEYLEGKPTSFLDRFNERLAEEVSNDYEYEKCNEAIEVALDELLSRLMNKGLVQGNDVSIIALSNEIELMKKERRNEL